MLESETDRAANKACVSKKCPNSSGKLEIKQCVQGPVYNILNKSKVTQCPSGLSACVEMMKEAMTDEDIP